MEKRVFLAIFLSFAVLAIYQAYFAPAPATSPASARATPSGSSASVPSAPSAAAANPPSAQTLPASAPAVTDAAGQEIRVDTATVSAVFTTKGAVLKNWRLKKYSNGEGQPLELVPQDIPETFPRPFAIAVDDAAASAVLRSAIYQPSTEELSLGSGAGTLSFSYQDASGITAHKTFQFQPAGKAYVVAVEAAVVAGGKSQPGTVQCGACL